MYDWTDQRAKWLPAVIYLTVSGLAGAVIVVLVVNLVLTESPMWNQPAVWPPGTR